MASTIDLEIEPERGTGQKAVDIFLQEERRSADNKLRIRGKGMSADAARHCWEAITFSDIPGVLARAVPLGNNRFAVEVIFDDEGASLEFKWRLTERGPLMTYRVVFLRRRDDDIEDIEE